MKPALHDRKPAYPQSWDDLPVGAALKYHVEQSIDESIRRFFGYHLVKVGCLSRDVSTSACSIKHVVSLVGQNSYQPDTTNAHSTVIGDATSLPFAEHSVDAFLLAHELDFSKDPHQILREVDRALIPNGHVVIVGFNPFSLAGLFRLLPLKSNRTIGEARFFSSMRINDWLHLLGFETIEQHQLVFSSLLLKKNYRLLTTAEKWFRRYLPIFSSMYVIVARKRVVPLSPIRPKWKPSPKFATARVTMREGFTINSNN